MKKAVMVLVFCLFAAVFAACGSGETPSSAAPTESSEAELELSDLEGTWIEEYFDYEFVFDSSGGWVWYDEYDDVFLEGILEERDEGYMLVEIDLGDYCLAEFNDDMSGFYLDRESLVYEFVRGGDDDEPEDYPAETVSTGEIEKTTEFATMVYSVFSEFSYETYDDMTTEQWLELSAEEKQEAYETFAGIHEGLGLSVSPQEEWLSAMDEDAEFYSERYVSGYAITNMGFEDPETLLALYRYAKGLSEGNYQPVHPEILAAADSLTVEYYSGSYLLCLGGSHSVAHLTRGWTEQESSFMQSGFVRPVGDDSRDYSIGGSEGSFTYADFGEFDLLPVLSGIGAIGESGELLGDQIDICARSMFDAPRLFVLTRQGDGPVTFAIAEYDADTGEYGWDGEVYMASDRCCFDVEGNFLYMDENGSLQTISEEIGRDAATLLMDILAEQMESKAVIETGEEEINGEKCLVFQFGVNTPERFEAEQHFAVSPDGDVYTMDVLQGPDWIPYQP